MEGRREGTSSRSGSVVRRSLGNANTVDSRILTINGEEYVKDCKVG